MKRHKSFETPCKMCLFPEKPIIYVSNVCTGSIHLDIHSIAWLPWFLVRAWAIDNANGTCFRGISIYIASISIEKIIILIIKCDQIEDLFCFLSIRLDIKWQELWLPGHCSGMNWKIGLFKSSILSDFFIYSLNWIGTEKNWLLIQNKMCVLATGAQMHFWRFFNAKIFYDSLNRVRSAVRWVRSQCTFHRKIPPLSSSMRFCCNRGSWINNWKHCCDDREKSFYLKIFLKKNINFLHLTKKLLINPLTPCNVPRAPANWWKTTYVPNTASSGS